MSDAGSSTSLPSIARFGVTPVVEWTVIREAAKTDGSFDGHFFVYLYAAARSIARMVRFALSVRPSERGWNAVVLVLYTPVMLQSSVTS